MMYNRLLFTLIGVLSMLITHSQTLSDPIPEEIKFSGLVVDLVTFGTMPAGGPNGNNHPDSRARINMIREVPGTDLKAVIDLNGYLYMMDASGNLNLYLNFNSQFADFKDASGKGTGSGAMAFHPEFATNGIFYTAHAEEAGSGSADFTPLEGGVSCQWVITRWVANDPSGTTFAGSKTELVRLEFTTNIHGMQDITFNPFATPEDEDYGLLYVCNGEGGGSERGYHNNIGRIDSYLGTIWRIDPEGSNSANGNYGIPTTNPYYDNSNAVKEIWAYGFRNPHRLSFEQREGETILFVGDIGQHNIEEINLVEKGGNYGWDHREGTFDYDWGSRNVKPLPEPDEGDYIYPVAQYDHDEGAAIALGYTWTNENHSLLNGQMLFSDILYGDLFHLPMDSLIQGRQYPISEAKVSIDGGPVGTFKEVANASRIDLRFSRDDLGQVWMFTKSDGNIYKVIIPDGNANSKPIADFTLDASSGNLPFEVNVDASGSSDFDNDTLTYSWDFGDGNTAEGVMVSHTYNEGGNFTISLVVNDGTINSATETKSVFVNTPPEAAFSVSDDTATVPASIIFDANGSSDPDGDILRYSWDFGDGETSALKTKAHTYYDQGSYLVKLTVEDRKGGESVAEKTIVVLPVVTKAGEQLRSVIVYPNPINEILKLDAQVTARYSIFDLRGTKLIQGIVTPGVQEVDLSSLRAGEYILKLISENAEFSQVIIKK